MIVERGRLKSLSERERGGLESVLTCVKSSVLLDVAELLESAVAVRAAVRLFTCVHADVLHELVIGRERLETLLALVRLRLAPVGVAGVHLHRRFGHENLITRYANNKQSLVNYRSHYIKSRKTAAEPAILTQQQNSTQKTVAVNND